MHDVMESAIASGTKTKIRILPDPRTPEIDHRTIKLLVGLTASFLAIVTGWLAEYTIPSISESYYAGPWAQAVFIGCLFAISAFLLCYNGKTRGEMIGSKVAALAGLGVALFPCGCAGHDEIIAHVHFGSAAVMFGILAYFCYKFHVRAQSKGYPQAKRRAYIYALCGFTIVLSMLLVAIDALVGLGVTRLVFYCEAAGLMAFGISWLTASRTILGIASNAERFSPFTDRPATD